MGKRRKKGRRKKRRKQKIEVNEREGKRPRTDEIAGSTKEKKKQKTIAYNWKEPVVQ